MTKYHGIMVSLDDAIEWVKSIETDDRKKQHVLNRLEYVRDQRIPVKVREEKFDQKWRNYYVCGQCGFGHQEVHWKFCPNCGYELRFPRPGEKW